MGRDWSHRAAAWFVLLAGAVGAGLTLWFHFPGHVSTDASMQLWEAWLGESVTWNPPAMSAMLRWLGGGPEAAGRMMTLNAVLTYGALAGTGAWLLARNRGSHQVLPWIRALLVVLVLANPVLFLYLGIVWKDVLFSTLVVAGTALGLAACATQGRGRWTMAVLSAAVLAVSVGVRQQGIFMAPVLVAIPVIAVAGMRGMDLRTRVWSALVPVAVFVAMSLLIPAAVARTIHTPPEYGSKVGFQGLMQYDTAGMVALSRTPTAALPVPVSEELRADVRRVYSPDRSDFMWTSDAVTRWLSEPGYEGVRQRWRTLVANEPAAYVRHKFGAFRSILNLDGVMACLPVHVGVDGPHENLRAIGFEPGLDRYDQSLYYFAKSIFRWPVYRHWVYVVALLAAGVATLAFMRRSRLKAGIIVAGVATALLYLSFLPTSIACDFRYLFAATCMVSLIWICLVCSLWTRSASSPAPESAGG
jgi:hypothetical protein